MKVRSCFLLFGIFVQISSARQIKSKEDHIRITPALENFSKLSNEEHFGDTNILDAKHHFIARETTAPDDNKNEKPVFKANTVETLTDFIQELVNILNTYEDTAFEDFFLILDIEMRKYHYTGCKFSELTQNEDTKNLLARALDMTRHKPVSFTKANINKIAGMLREKTHSNDVKILLDYINSLYRYTEQKFHKVLEELKHYRRMKYIKAHNELVNVIRHGVQDILFDHYTALDSNTRQGLRVKIQQFWNRFKNNPASRTNGSNRFEMNEISESDINSIKITENVANEVTKPKTYSKTDTQTNSKKVKVPRTSQAFDDTSNQDISYSHHDSERALKVKLKPKPRIMQDTKERKRLANPDKAKQPKPKARRDDDSKTDKLKSQIHKNTHNIGEYNAVINVQLANTELLNSLAIFKPLLDENSRYDTTLYKRPFKSTKPVPTEPMPNYIAMRAVAKPKSMKPTAHTTLPSRYSRTYKPIYNLVGNIPTLLGNDSKKVIELVNGKKRKRIILSRRTANIDVAAKDFNVIVIKRIDALEQDFQQLKEKVNVKSKKYDNYTDSNDAKDKVGNERQITLKYNVERLMNEYDKMNERELNKSHNDGNSTKNTEPTTKNSTYPKQSVINIDVAKTIVAGGKNISEVTKIHLNDTKAIAKAKNDNKETTVTVSSVKVTDTTVLEPVETTTVVVTTITENTEPVYYDQDPNANPYLQNGQLDPFGQIEDGFNLNNYGI